MSSITSSSYPVVTVSQSGDQFVVVRNGEVKKLTRSGLQSFIETLAPNTLLLLTDTPNSYVGQQGKALVVNATEDGMEFQAATAGNWLALADTPVSYGGNGLSLVRVNAAENGLEFVDDSFLNLQDTPASYAGFSERLVRVNTAANALEFIRPRDIQTTGWAYYEDTTYTAGSPFAVTAGTTVNLPNNAGTVIDSQIPTGVSSFYNGTVITPENDGDSYVFSIRLTTESSVNEGAIAISVDIGGSQGVIVSDFRRLARGVGTPNFVTMSFEVFSGSTFITNGGTVKFEAIAGNQNVYGIEYLITRTHRAK